jgi:hypothetical protein
MKGDLARYVAGLLVVLALALQALVPNGYMVGAAKAGGIEITLCTAQGSVAAIMTPDGQIIAKKDAQHGPSDDEQSDLPSCVFVGHNSVAHVALELPRVPPPTFATQERPQALRKTVAPGHGLAAPPPPKTGPPIQA